MTGRIRVIALGVVWRGDELLVFEGQDQVSGEVWYRPLGGEIEFGETGAQAVVRELNEEIGATVTNLRYLGTLEDLYIYEGAPAHELARIYECEFVDRELYGRAEFLVVEGDGTSAPGTWQPVTAFRTDHKPLYPDGLLDLLDGRTRA